MKDIREILEGALFSSIFLLMILTLYTPFYIFSILTPIPFIIYGYRNGIKRGTLMIIASSVAASLFGNIIFLGIAVFAGLVGMVMGILYKKNNSLSAIIGGIIVGAISLLLLIIISQFFFGFNYVETLKQTMLDSLDISRNFYLNFANEQELNQMVKIYKELINNIEQLLPFLIISQSILAVAVNHFFAIQIMKRLRMKIISLPPFREWRFPKSIMHYFILTILVINIKFLYNITVLKLIAINLYPLLQFITILQGVSFIFYLTYYKKWGKIIPVLTVTLIPFLSPLISILGMFDISFDLRKKLKSRG